MIQIWLHDVVLVAKLWELYTKFLYQDAKIWIQILSQSVYILVLEASSLPVGLGILVTSTKFTSNFDKNILKVSRLVVISQVDSIRYWSRLHKVREVTVLHVLLSNIVCEIVHKAWFTKGQKHVAKLKFLRKTLIKTTRNMKFKKS